MIKQFYDGPTPLVDNHGNVKGLFLCKDSSELFCGLRPTFNGPLKN